MVFIAAPKTEIRSEKATTVEEQKMSAKINQSHRCQRFGHAQSRCIAPPKCVKCASVPATHEREKQKETPA